MDVQFQQASSLIPSHRRQTLLLLTRL
ncbi:hypothetical protein MED222_05215 [Vibrio sp. MED222]|nr:hypothetical protein MED222_05215 [Vibrio sp. MED222]